MHCKIRDRLKTSKISQVLFENAVFHLNCCKIPLTSGIILLKADFEID